MGNLTINDLANSINDIEHEIQDCIEHVKLLNKYYIPDTKRLVSEQREIIKNLKNEKTKKQVEIIKIIKADGWGVGF